MIRTLKADESALKTLFLQVSKLAAKKGNSDSEKAHPKLGTQM